MKNNDLLMSQNQSNNKPLRPMRRNNKMVYMYSKQTEMFGLEELSDVLKYINSISRSHALPLVPIIINLGEIEFEDKLTYILFECLCYSIITKGQRNLKVYFKYKPNIFSEGIVYAPINKLVARTPDISDFLKRFNFDINRTHFRRVIKSDSSDIYFLSKLMTDIDIFLKNCDIEKECRQEISEVVSELVGNAREHAGSDCLVDLDITEKSYIDRREPESNDVYGGINIVVVNFSNYGIGEGISKKISALHNKLPMNLPRYQTVLEAKQNHERFFDENYTLDDFYILTSFQHQISGRIDNSDTGGTGLTTLIKALEERSADSMCYMLSGNRQVVFTKEYLAHDEHKWVGFNSNGNYLNSPPEKDCFSKSPIIMPGTAYNLNFVLKREESNESTNNE